MPTIRKSFKQIRRQGGGYIDREKFDATTEEDIARQLAEDPDAPAETTGDEFQRARIVRPSRTPEKA